MPNQFDNFLKVFKALDEHNVDYILIGGVAVILHGMERLTRDIDILVKMDIRNIDSLKLALSSIFNDPSINEITYDDLEQYPVIRYCSEEGFCIDIIARLGEVASFNDVEYEMMNYEGVSLKISTPEALYKLKKNTVRPRDIADAAFLKAYLESVKQDNK